MKNALQKFSNHQDFRNYEKGTPTEHELVSACADVPEVHYGIYRYKYLTFILKESGTVSCTTSNHTVEYSVDKGNTWNALTTTSSLAADTEIWFRGHSNGDGSYISELDASCSYDIEGNIMSLLYDDDYDDKDDLSIYDHQIFQMSFTGAISAKNLVLPAMKLSPSCYKEMFKNSLVEIPPKLPAIILSNNCYEGMFYDCAFLQYCPELPATVLANNCYKEMFARCNRLVNMCELPAIKMEEGCYKNMFWRCTLLEYPIEQLNALDLAKNCYEDMFNGCEKLRYCPELPATKLYDSCYERMFCGCSSIINIPELPAKIMANHCYSQMFDSCSEITIGGLLPAKKLALECYDGMFSGCSKLKYVKMLANDEYFNANYLSDMFSNTNNVHLFINPNIDLSNVDLNSLNFPNTLKICKELEYLTTDGNQYIELPYNGNESTDGLEMIFRCTSSTLQQRFLIPLDGQAVFVIYINGSGRLARSNNGSWTYFVNSDKHKIGLVKHHFIFDNKQKYCTFDGFRATYTNTNVSSNQHMCLFKSSASPGLSALIYKARFFRDGEFDIDLMPITIFENGSEVVHMYDVNSYTIYNNDGTGEFGKGIYKYDGLDEYDLLEYLENNQTNATAPYIDTDYVYKLNTSFTAEMTVKWNTVDSSKRQLFGSDQNPWWGCDGGVYKVNTNEIDGSDTPSVVDFQTVSVPEYNVSSNGNLSTLGLFRALSSTNMLQTATTYISLCKVKNVIFKEDSLPVRDFIPVKHPSGTLGMYDKIENKFYDSANSGLFIGKVNKKLSGYNRVEYLESTGTQYIDLGIIPDENTGIYIDVEFDNTMTDIYCCGLRENTGNTRWGIGRSINGFYYGYGSYSYTSPRATDLRATCTLNYLNDGIFSNYGGGKYMETNLPLMNFTVTKTIALFGTISPTTEELTDFHGKIYKVKVSQDHKIIMDLIPVCVDGVGYLYDNVSGKLFGNAGKDYFLVGNPIEDVEISKPYYSEIEYLESTGTQMINTGISGGSNAEYGLTLKILTQSTNYAHICGSVRNEIGAPKIQRTNNTNNWIAAWYNGSVQNTQILTQDSNIHTIEYKNGKIYVDGIEKCAPGIMGFGSRDFCIFNYLAESLGGSKIQLYNAWIKLDDILVRDYIPVKVGDIGYMFDKVTRELYSNSGTDTFILGSDIEKTKPYDSRVEYLESSSTQYIDLDIIPDENTGIRVNAQCLDNADTYIVGLREDTGNTRWVIGHTYDINNVYTGFYWGYGYYQETGRLNNASGELKLNWMNNKKYIGRFGTQLSQENLPQLSFTPTNVIRIFGSSGVDAAYTKWVGRIFNVQVSQGDRIIRDLIPVRVGNIGCLYDRITGKVLYNSGTGSFTYGEDVYDDEELFDNTVEYIESTGTQYIDFPLRAYVGEYFGIGGTMIPIYLKNYLSSSIFISVPDRQLCGYYYTYDGYSESTTRILYSSYVGGNSNSGGWTGYDGQKVAFELSTAGRSQLGIFNQLSRPLTQNVTELRLFASYEDDLGYPIKMCYVWIKAGEKILYDLIPVRIKNIGYLYDRITNRMMTNGGTGYYKIGPDI